MELAQFANTVGDSWTLVIGGLVIGALFGAAAQKSRFCLRAAAVEFSRGEIGDKVAIWLIVFTLAIAGTVAAEMAGVLSVREARQLASPQSLSGAALGGLMFGAGMILARGCASRLLVLSATGNLRALLSGLVFAVVAQASLRGFLSPAREAIAGQMTTVSTGGNDLLEFAGLGNTSALILTASGFAIAVAFAIFRRLPVLHILAAMLVGTVIPLTWWFTYAMGGIAFEPVQLEAVSFTGPSADFLMMFLSPPGHEMDFDIGLVPGVFIGSFMAAAMTGELKLQGFEGGAAMRRYLAGAALMGFGGMLAGGCAVGAGVTGASVFALTAWITLFAIWLSAGVTDYLVDRRPERAHHAIAAQAASPMPAE